MNSKNINEKSSQELKKEVMRELRNVDSDIERLKRRLSPGQIIDDAIFHKHDPRYAFEKLKRNPVGTTFLTIGTFLLMEDENQLSYESQIKVKSREAYTETRNRADELLQKTKDRFKRSDSSVEESGFIDTEGFMGSDVNAEASGSKYEDLKSTARTKLEDAKSQLEGAKSQVSSQVSDAKSNLSSKLNETKSMLNSKVEEAKNRFSSKANDMSGAIENAKTRFGSAIDSTKENFRNRTHDSLEAAKSLDPLAYVALGAGLGALTGASLPVSDRERAFVDERLSEKFEEFKQDMQAAFNESTTILKNELLSDFKDFNFNLFGGGHS